MPILIPEPKEVQHECPEGTKETEEDAGLTKGLRQCPLKGKDFMGCPYLNNSYLPYFNKK